jgi:leader peptidase (prepilin peptidase)/N-methyltransferase
MSSLSVVVGSLVVGSAFVVGLAVGALGRRWLATLRRGAVIGPGRLEAASALTSASSVFLSWDDGRWPLVLWIGVLMVPLAAVDLVHHRLPDAITLPAIPITLVAVLATTVTADLPVVSSDGGVSGALLGGLVLGGLFHLLVLLSPRSMGAGDAKLAYSVGIALGSVSWAALLTGTFAAFVLGAIAGIVGLATRRVGLRSSIAFGPAMLLGCWLVLALPALAARV